MYRSTRWARRVALAAAMALALGVAGCGDDDSDAANDGSGGGSADTAGGFTGQEAEINAVLVGIQDDFVKRDGASYCDKLATAGIRQVERFGKAFGHGSDCVKVIDTVAENTHASGIEQKPTKLISVEFKDDRAIATIRNGGRPPEPMVFVNDRGDWKIPNPGFQPRVGASIDSEPLSADPKERFDQVKRTSDAVKKRREQGAGGGQ